MKSVELLLLIILAVGSGAAGGYYAATRAASEIADAPFAVVDVKQFIEQAITGPNGELQSDQVAVGIQKAGEVAEALSNRGYIVLDKQGVLAAPAQYHVAPLPQAPENAQKRE